MVRVMVETHQQRSNISKRLVDWQQPRIIRTRAMIGIGITTIIITMRDTATPKHAKQAKRKLSKLIPLVGPSVLALKDQDAKIKMKSC
jgi:hypothetical protein